MTASPPRSFRVAALGFLGTWSAWLVLTLLVTGFTFAGNRRTVTEAYRDGAARWVAGEHLYDGSGTGFIYFPTAAVLFVPFAALPYVWGEVLWRLLNIVVFAAGMRAQVVAWTSAESSGDAARREQLFLWTSWLLLPVCFKAVFNAQSTIVMAGLMLLACARFVRGSNGIAAGLLAAAVAVKPLAAVPAMLLGAARVRALPRFALAGLALFAAPFLFQAPAYVLDQWRGVGRLAADADRAGRNGMYCQLFNAIRPLGIEFAPSQETLLRLVAAAATLGLVLLSVRSKPGPRSALEPYALAVCWLLTMSPRTESNTYAMLGPYLGLEAAAAWTAGVRGRWSAIGWTLLIVAVPGSYELAKLSGAIPAVAWPACAVGCICAGVLTWRILGRTWDELTQSIAATAVAGESPISETPRNETPRTGLPGKGPHRAKDSRQSAERP